MVAEYAWFWKISSMACEKFIEYLLLLCLSSMYNMKCLSSMLVHKVIEYGSVCCLSSMFDLDCILSMLCVKMVIEYSCFYDLSSMSVSNNYRVWFSFECISSICFRNACRVCLWIWSIEYVDFFVYRVWKYDLVIEYGFFYLPIEYVFSLWCL